MSKGTGVLRERNQKRILALLRKNKISYRLEIAQSLGLSKNTVSLIIDQFMKEGLVKETGMIDQKGAGRPRKMVSLVAGTYTAIGLSITEAEIEYSVMDYCTNIIEEGKFPLESKQADETIGELITCCQRLMGKFPGVIGVGVGVPGLVDPHKGLVYHSTKLNWSRVDLGKTMDAELGINVWIFNNVKVAALGAMEKSSQGDRSSTFYIRISEGIGGAMIIDNRVFNGGAWTAGEIGHISVDPDGPLCECGQFGCLEKLISVLAFKESLRNQFPNHFKNHNIQEMFGEVKDLKTTHELLGKYGQYLGSAITQVIHLLNPEVIIVESPYNDFGVFRENTLRTTIQKSLKFSFEQTEIKFGENSLSPAIGAAISVIYKLEEE